MYQRPDLFRLRTFALLTLFVHPLFGGVVLDGSFGKSGALPGPNFMIQSSFGKQVGGNLFQSFNQFNIISSESATFSGPSTVHNILARVTNGSPSSIDGAVNSSIQGANLFFLNPAGVVFGKNTQINVSGSFAVSTANYLKLADGGKFNTSLGGGDVLTSAPVSAFGFLNSAPKGVSIVGEPFSFPPSNLNVAPRKCFSIAAGDITINGRTITGLGSRVNLVSVKSPGEVRLDATNLGSNVDVTQFTAMGQINLTNFASINTSGPGGGPIIIRGGALSLAFSDIISFTQGDSPGAPINIAVTGSFFADFGAVSAGTVGKGTGGEIRIAADSVHLHDLTRIATNSLIHFSDATRSDTGNCGNITITAKSLLLDGVGVPGLGFSTISSITDNGGNAGNVTLNVRDIQIAAGQEITTSTGGNGNGGNILLNSDSISISSGYIKATTGFASFFDNTGTGNGGNIIIHTGTLSLNFGLILASTDGAGRGGAVKISANRVFLDSSVILAESNPDNFFPVSKFGDAGSIEIIAADQIELMHGSNISATTSTEGNGGNIRLTAASIMIDGTETFGFGRSAITSETLGSGNAGDVVVQTGDLTVTNGGKISAGTFSSGEGGDVTVHAGSLSIDGSATPGFFTGISAQSNRGATGGAGDVNVTVDQALNIAGGGKISSSTFGFGNGGNVNVTADSLLIDGPGSTGIFAEAEDGSSGTAGSIVVQTRDLRINAGGQISSSSIGMGNGGDVTVTADSLLIEGGVGMNGDSLKTGIFADTGLTIFDFPNFSFLGSGNAGNVIVRAGNLTITNGGEISSSTQCTGDAGDVKVTADSLSIDHGGIFAVTIFPFGGGDAGNIFVEANDLKIAAGGTISSSTSGAGNGGNVTVVADSLLIDGTGPFEQFLSGRTGIFAEASGDRFLGIQAGEAGNISVQARDLKVINGGEISANTGVGGNGGNISVIADSLLIEGGVDLDGFPIPTGIFAETSAFDTASGNAGNITVQAHDLRITGGGAISVSTDLEFGTFEDVTGGNISIMAGSLLIDGASSGIFAEARGDSGGAKAAGSVFIQTSGPMNLDHGGSISTSSVTSDAGSIDIISGGEIKLRNHSGITVSGSRNGGDITIKAPVLVSLIDSKIDATAGQVGGNITIDPIALQLKNSTISASAPQGQGGQINLFTSFLVGPVKTVAPGVISLAFNSSITATGGTSSGTVNITAPELDLGAELITLPASLLSAESQLQERCTALLQGDFSSFISIGRGGTEPAPEELQTTF